MELETCARFCSCCFPCRFWVQSLLLRACWHSSQGNDFSRSYHLPLQNHYGEVYDFPRDELSSSARANPNPSECLMFQIQDDQSTLMSFLLHGPVSTASNQHITNVKVRHTWNCICKSQSADISMYTATWQELAYAKALSCLITPSCFCCSFAWRSCTVPELAHHPSCSQNDWSHQSYTWTVHS
jgi:hypothetical protein